MNMFKYKLEPILALKEKIEENKKREFGIAHQSYERAKSEKAILVKAQEQAYHAARTQKNDSINIIQLKQLNHYTNYMKKEISAKDKEIVSAEQQVEQKRNELVEAVKERKILENLKEIQLQEYKEEENKKENARIDEIVTYKYRLNKKE